MNDVPYAIATTTIAGAAFVWTVLTAPSLLYLWWTRLPESLHRRGSKRASTSRPATVSGIPAGGPPDAGASDCRERAVDSPAGTGPPPQPALPKVSVIVAARDEAARVADCLRSILASDYPDFELIAVDDRSTDGTGQRMDEVAAADPRCRVVHITELPEGWLGKCWALHCGTRAARGAWLLFCDGDVLLAPDCVQAAIAEATRCGLDHLALMPGMAGNCSYAEACLLTAFGWLLASATQPWLIPVRGTPFFAGVGAFNLVRRETYERFGGHHRLRLQVIDDMQLGRLVKSVGGRSAIRMARSLVRVRWQDSALQIIHGLEKNAFASLGFSWAKLALLTVLFAIITWGPYAAAGTVVWRSGSSGDSHTVVAAAMGLAVPHVLFGLCGAVFGTGWTVAPAFPVALSAIVFAFWRSAWLTTRQGGVRWRDTFYPLSELRSFARHAAVPGGSAEPR